MSLRPSGFWCDVCNEPMAMEMLLNTPIKGFKVSCSPSELHNHDKCKHLIEPACKNLDDSLLPEGSPLGTLIRKVKKHNADLTNQTGSK